MKLTKPLLTLLLFSSFILSSCKKDGPSYEELLQFAMQKTEEAVALTKGHPCNNLAEWRIDTINNRYVPVHPSFEAQYNMLKKEANELYRRANEVYDGPIVYHTSVVELPPHFGIRCIDGEIKIALANDLDKTEIESLLTQLFSDITTFFIDIPCNDPSKWRSIPIRKDCEITNILYTDTPNFPTFRMKLQQYMHLEIVKADLDNCSTFNPTPVKEIVCENGKPKLVY